MKTSTGAVDSTPDSCTGHHQNHVGLSERAGGTIRNGLRPYLSLSRPTRGVNMKEMIVWDTNEVTLEQNTLSEWASWWWRGGRSNAQMSKQGCYPDS
eukprot:scaffold415355_cov41-Prasinocladus_malaysianus.AAC.1